MSDNRVNQALGAIMCRGIVLDSRSWLLKRGDCIGWQVELTSQQGDDVAFKVEFHGDGS